MKLTFVPCGLEHLEELLDISRATFANAFEASNDPSDFKTYLTQAFSQEKLRMELLNPESFFFLIYQNTSLAAYLKINTGSAQSEFKESHSIELERIYVTSTYQGKGMGVQLLCFVFNLAKQKKATYVWLGVWEKNTRAIAFYLKNGFKKIGSHPYCIGTDEQTDWLMQKEVIK